MGFSVLLADSKSENSIGSGGVYGFKSERWDGMST